MNGRKKQVDGEKMEKLLTKGKSSMLAVVDLLCRLQVFPKY